MANPTLYTPELADQICELIAGGENQRAACAIVGVSYWTFWEWKRDNREGFNDRVMKIYTEDYPHAVADRFRNKIVAQQQIVKHAFEMALTASLHENPTYSMVDHRKFAQAEAEITKYVNGIDPKLLELEQKWLAFDLPRRHRRIFGDKGADENNGVVTIKVIGGIDDLSQIEES
jgi:hypothetical protein